MAAELSKCDFRNDRSVSLDVIQLSQENKNLNSERLAQRCVLVVEARTDVAGCVMGLGEWWLSSSRGKVLKGGCTS